MSNTNTKVRHQSQTTSKDVETLLGPCWVPSSPGQLHLLVEYLKQNQPA